MTYAPEDRQLIWSAMKAVPAWTLDPMSIATATMLRPDFKPDYSLGYGGVCGFYCLSCEKIFLVGEKDVGLYLADGHPYYGCPQDLCRQCNSQWRTIVCTSALAARIKKNRELDRKNSLKRRLLCFSVKCAVSRASYAGAEGI